MAASAAAETASPVPGTSRECETNSDPRDSGAIKKAASVVPDDFPACEFEPEDTIDEEAGESLGAIFQTAYNAPASGGGSSSSPTVEGLETLEAEIDTLEDFFAAGSDDENDREEEGIDESIGELRHSYPGRRRSPPTPHPEHNAESEPPEILPSSAETVQPVLHHRSAFENSRATNSYSYSSARIAPHSPSLGSYCSLYPSEQSQYVTPTSRCVQF